MLDRMKRGVTTRHCLNTLKLTESVGIPAEGNFVTGMSDETGHRELLEEAIFGETP